MKTALILIDIQNDYFPGGRMELQSPVEASQRANQILSFFRESEWPVFHIQHISTRSGASFFLPNTQGAEIHENVRPLEGEPVIQKHFPNSFRNTDLLEQLKSREIEQVVICGMMTHMCVDATARAAFDFGFSCVVIHNACATRDLVFQGITVPAEHVHASFLAALNGIYASVISAEEFIAQGIGK